MIEVLGLRFEKRDHSSRLWQVLMVLLAIIVALIISGVPILSSGANVGKAFAGLYGGAFGSLKAFIETLVKATPLILTGLAATIAFRGKIMNIGAEGQFLAGAITGYWAIVNFTWLPPGIHFFMILLSAFIGGAFCGLIPGLLKGILKVDETIVTVMMNYVVTFILSYLLSDPWRAPGEFYKFSAQIPESAQYAVVFPNYRLHVGFIVALVAAIIVFWLLQKTRLGYEIRAIGLNSTAAKFKGINVSRVIIIVMMISGGVAGLGGIGEVIGIQHRLRMDISGGAGFTGIIIAMLAGLNPLAVIAVAIFMGGLINGSNRMQIFSNVPTALVYAMQAIVLLCLLSFQVLANYRIRRLQKVE
jgi:simple sugar transport system permease protein